MRLALGLCLFGTFALYGCGSEFYAVVPSTPSKPLTGVPVSGHIFSGAAPVVGAHVYLFAAGASGYGGASLSLLASNATGTADDTGSYVLSAQDGSFTLPGDYTCSSTSQLYLYASGGNSGLGVNLAASEMAALGTCPVPGSTVAPLVMNEVTTVAAAFALAGFATDALHIASSGTPLALTGIAHAFGNAASLASTATGTALSEIPAGTGTAPQATVNTLANIAAACVHSSGPASTPCSTLFANKLATGSVPSDTATAMIGIAHSAANVDLYALQTSSSPFTPALMNYPYDFTLSLVFTGGGLSYVNGLAIDAEGNAWAVSQLSGAVTEISSSGAFLSGPNGYTPGLVEPGPVAIDTSGNAWIGNYSGYLCACGSIVELSSSGTVLSGPNGYTGGGIAQPRGIAFDPAGNVWVANPEVNTVTELSSIGEVLSGPNGITGAGIGGPVGIAVQSSGNIWVTDIESFAVSELSPSGQSLQGPNGLTAPGFYGGQGVAIDSQGDVWVTNQGTYAQVSKLSSTGGILSGPDGYTGGGLGPVYDDGATNLAIDGTGNVWLPILYVRTFYESTIVELSNNGTPLSGPNGFASGTSNFSGGTTVVAIDGSGDVWFASGFANNNPNYLIAELIGAASPVVTPLAAGVKTNRLGTRP